MNSIIHTGQVTNGLLEIPMGKQCDCYIGLVSISIPNLHTRHVDCHEISIACDQIDSTVLNPKRLLRRIYYISKNIAYTTFQFQTVTYNKIDSADSTLTIRMTDQNGKFPARSRDANVTIVLNLLPLVSNNSNKCYI